jgi:hypothetical protein
MEAQRQFLDSYCNYMVTADILWWHVCRHCLRIINYNVIFCDDYWRNYRLIYGLWACIKASDARGRLFNAFSAWLYDGRFRRIRLFSGYFPLMTHAFFKSIAVVFLAA